MSINEAVERVAGKLPDYYTVELEVSQGCACVYWYDDEGNQHDVELPDDTIAEQLLAALERAIQHKRDNE